MVPILLFPCVSLKCGSLGTWRHFGLVTRLALSRERGMVAVLAYPYLLLVALTL